MRSPLFQPKNRINVMTNIALATEQQQLVSAVEEQAYKDFNALDFENKHHKDFQNAHRFYIDYEIDSVEDDFGELFRLWNGRILLGTFYKTSSGWKATPFYSCRQYIKLDKDLSKNVQDSDEATAYLKGMYEGISENSVSSCLATA